MKQSKNVLKRKKAMIRQRQRKVRTITVTNSTKKIPKLMANQCQQQKAL